MGGGWLQWLVFTIKNSKAQQVGMKFFQYENMIRFQICIKIKGSIFVCLLEQKYFISRHSSIWEREGNTNSLAHFKKIKMTTQMGSVAVNVLAMKQLYKYIKNHI